MDEFEIVIPTLLGLESLTSREIKRLGYENVKVEDGRVTFTGDMEAVYRANTWIRAGERVLIKVGEFTAVTFEELFEGAKSLDWSRWIGKNDAFPVKGYSLKSKLASVRDCQAIIKKAVAQNLSDKYGIEWLPEDGINYQIQFSIMKDKVTLMIDTTGEGLHKRGYRQISNVAPLKETLAAALVEISFWKFEYPLCDPFCGSGTIPIEAAMIKKNIAPGRNRSFAADLFSQMDKKIVERVKDEAFSLERDIPLEIYAYDIDKDNVSLSASNAEKAGVGKYIKVDCADAREIKFNMPYGTIICNPPYGERISDVKECEKLYRDIGKSFQALDRWSYYILTSNEHFEDYFVRKANKKRKLYNGMIKCDYYQYFGERPPKKQQK